MILWEDLVEYSRPVPYAPRTDEALLAGEYAQDSEDWTLPKVAAVCLAIQYVLLEKPLPVRAVEALAREARRNLRRKDLLIRRAKDPTWARGRDQRREWLTQLSLSPDRRGWGRSD